ncbi:MAG: DUF177 domain-containing protein [Chloroflexi bacterium]|nr:DUF177 domain-containing protein [Chloroflexota bacterium]
MKFNVAQLLKDPVGSTRQYSLTEPLEVPGEDPKPVSGTVLLLRTNRGVLVRGPVTTWVACVCSRCLSLYSQEIHADLEEEFFPTIDVNSGTPVPLPLGEEELFIIDEHHILDLTEALRQQSLLALPMKPLCRPDCAGLCPTCGQNLNLELCQCSNSPHAPRWAALRDLAKGQNPGED